MLRSVIPSHPSTAPGSGSGAFLAHVCASIATGAALPQRPQHSSLPMSPSAHSPSPWPPRLGSPPPGSIPALVQLHTHSPSSQPPPAPSPDPIAAHWGQVTANIAHHPWEPPLLPQSWQPAPTPPQCRSAPPRAEQMWQLARLVECLVIDSVSRSPASFATPPTEQSVQELVEWDDLVQHLAHTCAVPLPPHMPAPPHLMLHYWWIASLPGPKGLPLLPSPHLLRPVHQAAQVVGAHMSHHMPPFPALLMSLLHAQLRHTMRLGLDATDVALLSGRCIAGRAVVAVKGKG